MTTKKKKQSIPKALRMKLWEQQCGDTLSGNCYTCCRIVKIDDFQAGHIIAEANGGQLTLNNLKVICKPCNTSCGTMNLNCFKQLLETQNDSVPLPIIPLQTVVAQQQGLLQQKKKRPYVKKVKSVNNTEPSTTKIKKVKSVNNTEPSTTKLQFGSKTKVHSNLSSGGHNIFGPNTSAIISAIGINYGPAVLKW